MSDLQDHVIERRRERRGEEAIEEGRLKSLNYKRNI